MKIYQTKRDENDNSSWQFINEDKKDQFLILLREKLLKINLREQPEKILASLTDATITSMDAIFQIKKLSKSAKKRALTPWYGNKIYEGEKKQSRLFRRFIKSKLPEDYQAYKEFRKQLSRQKYRAKRSYYRNLLADANTNEDRTATWEVINKAFGKTKNRVYPEKGSQLEVTSNQKKEASSKRVANDLNIHFTSVAKKLAKYLRKSNVNFTTNMGKKKCLKYVPQ